VITGAQPIERDAQMGSSLSIGMEGQATEQSNVAWSL
jgi:hypothetical protein